MMERSKTAGEQATEYGKAVKQWTHSVGVVMAKGDGNSYNQSKRGLAKILLYSGILLDG